MKFFPLAAMLLCPLLATAQLAVTVTPAKVVGQKAVVQLKMKNDLGEAVKSARAVCFLLDDQGKMVGQSTKWVVGQNHASLEPKAEATFNFVITSPQPFTTTNLAAKISFSRVVLDGGKLADVKRDVSVTAP
jgi:dihydroneopterin aldolase